MAANPQNQQPQFDYRAQKEFLKKLIDDQGDYNNLLKDSIKDLAKLKSSYDQIEARLENITESSINIKEIEREIQKLGVKKYIEQKKLEELQKDMSSESLSNLQKAKDFTKDLVDEQERITGKKLSQLEIDKLLQETLATQGDLEATRLFNQEKLIELSQEQVASAEKRLSLEKKIRADIGFTGAAFKFLAEKLGVAESYTEQMVINARKLNEEGKNFGFFDKLALLGKVGLGALAEVFKDPAAFAIAFKIAESAISKMGEAFSKAGDLAKSFSEDSSSVVSGVADPIADLVSNIPLVGGLLSGLVKGMASFLDLIVGVEDKIVKMGRNLNLSASEAMALNKQFAEMSLHSGDVFMNSKKLMESQVELSDQLGVNNTLSEEMLETNNKLREFAGLEADTRAKIAQLALISGKSSEGIVKSVIAQVQGLKSATGISFNYQKILGEASRLGGALGLQFSKYPDKLAKSLVITKALGVDLQKLDGLADSFLDFESSISNEFEAQLLTGKEINLQKAREAFLNNDLATAAAEITKQVGTSSEFLSMNRISAESLAKGFGMSRDELADMLKQQEMLSKFGAKDTKQLQEQVMKLKEQGREREAILKLGSEEAYQNMVNASTQERMMGFIEKIKQSIVDFLTNSGIVEKIQGFIKYLTEPKNVQNIMHKVQGFIADAVEFIGNAIYYTLQALDVISFGQIPNDFIESIQSGAASFGANIRSMGGGFESAKPETISNKLIQEASKPTNVRESGFAKSTPIMVTNNIQMEPIGGTTMIDTIIRGSGEQNKIFNSGAGSGIRSIKRSSGPA